MSKLVNGWVGWDKSQTQVCQPKALWPEAPRDSPTLCSCPQPLPTEHCLWFSFLPALDCEVLEDIFVFVAPESAMVPVGAGES